MKGVYILVIFLKKDREITIGFLGKGRFKKGYYAYAGSAMGGLEQRIRRHLRKDKKLHWHIDYFLQKAEVKKVFVKETASKSDECKSAGILKEAGGFPLDGFGSSDCKCGSHLFYFKNSFRLPDATYNLTSV